MTSPTRLAGDPIEIGNEVCPWCEQPIPHKKFEELKARIEAEERERTAQVERRLEAEVAQAKVAMETKADEERRRLIAEAEEERTRLIAEADAKLSGAVEEAIKTSAEAYAAELDEAEKARASAEELVDRLKAEQVEMAADAEVERERLASEADAKVQAAVAEANQAAADAVAAALADAEKAKTAAQEEVDALRAGQEEALEGRLQELRTVLEKDKTDALNAEKARNFGEQQKIQEKLELMQRQLQKKTADELGEGAEIDLFEALKGAFPDDIITRVAKGLEGADIVHKVRASGRECGSIVYDSKNRTAWRNDYVTKLRKDQLAAKADHAILAALVFPAGTKQLHIQDSVLVCNPARVLVLVEVLRKQIIQIDTMRLSADARAEKTAELYEFMTSEQCNNLFEQLQQVSEDILELDVKEKKAHELVWKKRGELVRAIQRAEVDLSTEVGRIVGGQKLRAVK